MTDAMSPQMIEKIVALHKQPGDPEFVLDNGPGAKPMAVQYREWIAKVDAHRKESGVTPATLQAPPETHFPQPKITGYRQLSDAEVALMNEVKALAEQCGALVAKLRGPIPDGQSFTGTAPPLDQRWISMGASDLQVGFMKLIRGIAQPTSF